MLHEADALEGQAVNLGVRVDPGVRVAQVRQPRVLQRVANVVGVGVLHDMIGCHARGYDRLLPDEDILDVDEEQDGVGEVGHGAPVMDPAGELLPLELDQLLDQASLEDPDLLGAGDRLHDAAMI